MRALGFAPTRVPPPRRASRVAASSSDDAASALRRLGLDARDAATLTARDVRDAYRATMRDAHPDAARGSTARALAVRAAYERAMASARDGTLASASDGDGDAFAAKTLARTFDGARHGFVAATRCRGAAACASSCVEAAPRSFVADATTGKARWIERDDFGDASADETSALAYAEWCASERCPEKCIAFVTRRQREFMLEVLENDDGASGVDAFLRELVETAEYVNGREAGRRRARARERDE